MVAVKAALVTLMITVYVPMAGGINGGGVTSSGKEPIVGYAACGWRYPFGTVFEVVGEDMSLYGLPQVLVCMDRGGMVSNGHLDIALVSPDVRGDLSRAKQWGKRARQVRVFASMDAYRRYKSIEARDELGGRVNPPPR
jgi:hypothetical protein